MYSPSKPKPANKKEFAPSKRSTMDGHPGTVGEFNEIKRVTADAVRNTIDDKKPR